MARRFALAASLLLLGSGVAFAAEPPPLLLLYAPGDAGDVRASLEGSARRNGTAFIDLSPVDPPPPKAGQHLSRAIDAYHDLKYETALAQLDAALAEAAATGAAGLTPSELSDLLVYRALVHTEQGDSTRAWDDMVRAATLDPTRRLDPVRFPPRAAEAFQRAVEAVEAGGKSSVTVAAPAGCAAHLDGREVALDAATRVPVGEHYLRVTCEGMLPHGSRVVVSGDEHTLRPKIAAPEPVSPKDAAELVERRGGTSFILAVVTDSPEAERTVSLRLYDAATVKQRGAVIAGASGGVATATQKLIDQVVRPTVVIKEVPQKIPWYEKPWVWGVAGVAVTSAILLPFVLDSGPADSADFVPQFP